MPSSYTRNLGLEKPATGEQAGVWGDTANSDYDFLDTAIDGNTSISIGNSGYTLSTTQGAVSEGRNKVVVWTGALTLDATVNIAPNTAEKWYIMQNATSGSRSIIFQQGAGGTFTLASGASAIIYCDGAGSGARVSGAFYNPQFGSVVIGGQVSGSSFIKGQASDTANYLQFQKDATPTFAASIGMSLPGGALSNDLIFGTYASSVWSEHLRIKSSDGGIEARGLLTTLQRQVAVSDVVLAASTAAALEIRETNLVGAAQSGNEYAPRITFNWSGRFARQLGMDATGVLAALNADGTIGNFSCQALQAASVTAVTISGVATLAVATVNATTVNATTLVAPTWNGTTWSGHTMAAGTVPTADQVIAADAGGVVNFGLVDTVSADNGTVPITRVYASSDSRIRYYTLAHFASQVSALIPPSPQTPWATNIDQAGHSLISSDGIVRIGLGQQVLQSCQGVVTDLQMASGYLQFYSPGANDLWVKFRDPVSGTLTNKRVSIF